jgi:hypothetical protein
VIGSCDPDPAVQQQVVPAGHLLAFPAQSVRAKWNRSDD